MVPFQLILSSATFHCVLALKERCQGDSTCLGADGVEAYDGINLYFINTDDELTNFG